MYGVYICVYHALCIRITQVGRDPFLLLTAYYLLLTSYFLLLTTDFLLFTTYYTLLARRYRFAYVHTSVYVVVLPVLASLATTHRR